MNPWATRLAIRADGRGLVACAGIDPSPDAVALLARGRQQPPRADRRVTVAAAMERFGGMVVEAVRDHVVAIKPQIAWFEGAGAPGLRALERVVEHARRAGLLVVLDSKRGDVAHSATAYAEAWLGEDATSGVRCDAMTVHASIGADALDAMAQVAAARGAGLYALLHTSNAGAVALQGARLDDGRVWWQLVAEQLARVDAAVGGDVVGAVVGATHTGVLDDVRAQLPTASLLLPGVGAQGASVSDLAPVVRTDALPSLVPVSRALLPTQPLETAAFRHAITTNARRLARELDAVMV